MFRPYLRIRPAVWVQTRLWSGSRVSRCQARGLGENHSKAEECRNGCVLLAAVFSQVVMDVGLELRSLRTKTDCLSRRCVGASTRRSRETWLLCGVGGEVGETGHL